MARSALAGWGLFTRHALHRHEFVGEYTGEIVSRAESERRGLIYDRMGVSYLFTLNSGGRGCD